VQLSVVHLEPVLNSGYRVTTNQILGKSTTLYQIIQIARSLGWIVYYVIAEMFGERDSSECASKIVDDLIHHHEKQLLQIINPLPEKSLTGFNKLWRALVTLIVNHLLNMFILDGSTDS
jgi:hypothetical protein